MTTLYSFLQNNPSIITNDPNLVSILKNLCVLSEIIHESFTSASVEAEIGSSFKPLVKSEAKAGYTYLKVKDNKATLLVVFSDLIGTKQIHYFSDDIDEPWIKEFSDKGTLKEIDKGTYIPTRDPVELIGRKLLRLDTNAGVLDSENFKNKLVRQLKSTFKDSKSLDTSNTVMSCDSGKFVLKLDFECVLDIFGGFDSDVNVTTVDFYIVIKNEDVDKDYFDSIVEAIYYTFDDVIRHCQRSQVRKQWFYTTNERFKELANTLINSLSK